MAELHVSVDGSTACPASVGGMESAFWFGPAARPLAGRLHLPNDREVHGGAVICPGLGWDRTVGYRTLRRLARRLANSGMAVLQFDYDGTGDSWGDHRDPDRVAAWLKSIVAAVDWLREWGVPDATLVGLRHGATLAAHAAALSSPSAVVLWDPVLSGKQFVRVLRAFDRIHGFTSEPGTLSMAGTTFTTETIAALGNLDLIAADAPTLAVLRPNEKATPALDDATVVYRDGQEQLLDGDSISARVPTETLSDIAAWIVARAPVDCTVVRSPDQDSTHVGDICERFVRMGGMAGVETTPVATGCRPDAPTVLLLNNAVEPRTGPGRAWTEWSRGLAALGFRSLRADLSGIGDSCARTGTPEQLPWGPHILSDIQELAAAADMGAGVVLVGLCSGGRNALDATAMHGPESSVRLLMLLNPPLIQDRSLLAQITVDDPQPTAIVRANTYRRIRHNIAARTPAAVWRLLNNTGIFRAQTESLRRVVATGTEVLLVYSQGDFGLFKLRQNARWAVADLEATGRFALHKVAGADHALFGAPGRRAVLELLTEHLLLRYPARSPTTTSQ